MEKYYIVLYYTIPMCVYKQTPKVCGSFGACSYFYGFINV